MKRTTKGIVSVMLACLMLVLASLPCMAAWTEVPKQDDNLMVHWDFNGEGAEALKDKATADGISSDLTNVNGKAVVSGGTAVVSEAEAASLQTYGFTQFKDAEEVTIYMKVKVTVEHENFENLFFVPNVGSKFRIMTQKGYDSIRAACWHNPQTQTSLFTKNEQKQWNNGDWIYVALVFDGDGSNPLTRLYQSADGYSYHTIATNPNGSATSISKQAGKNTLDMYLGSFNPDGNDAIFEYDEVRIYNKALTEKDIQYLSKRPTAAGVQESGVVGDTQSIRFLGTVDALDYQSVGFRVELEESGVSGKKAVERSGKSVYGSINALGTDGEVTAMTAQRLGGKYVFALTLTGMPAVKAGDTDKTLTFTVIPFAIDINGDRIEGTPITAVYVNGVCQSVSY